MVSTFPCHPLKASTQDRNKHFETPCQVEDPKHMLLRLGCSLGRQQQEPWLELGSGYPSLGYARRAVWVPLPSTPHPTSCHPGRLASPVPLTTYLKMVSPLGKPGKTWVPLHPLCPHGQDKWRETKKWQMPSARVWGGSRGWEGALCRLQTPRSSADFPKTPC